ncbi:hypothetical protein [Pedobacter africanus]|uniref:Uncharacterized protein n=1 Tax=Pedobacter africanus TaxID=151894 RepID=A0A1W2CTB3_9SPHI|nr:hypothetical protein [Pedobacter africanus]SMC88495.1 hypothetical protein SAMN04488524_3197 [Pedobacter africanus]
MRMTEQKILDELLRIHGEGYPLTQKQLLILRRSDILNSIRKYGTLSSFKEKLGLKLLRRSWTNEQILHKYHELRQQLGYYPSARQLNCLGHGNLEAIIKSRYGGFRNFYKIIGYEPKRKPKKYWTKENTIKETLLFCEQNWDLIQKTSLSNAILKNKRSDLDHAICMYGGIRKLNDELNLELKTKRPCWTESEIITELLKLKDLGYSLTQKNLRKLDRNDLLGAMMAHGSFKLFREKIGIPIGRNHYWSDERIIEELKELIKIYKFIPSRVMMMFLGKGDLASAMAKRGGYKKFCRLLNVNSSQYYLSNAGVWTHSSYECIFHNILFKYQIPHKTQVQICKGHKYTADFYVYDTYIEIVGYSQKSNPGYFQNLELKIKLYNEMKLPYRIIPKAIFIKSVNLAENKILAVLKELELKQNSETRSLLAVDKDLPQRTQSDISPPQFRYHNMPIDLLNYDSSRIMETPIDKELATRDIFPITYWADIDNIKKELLPLVNKYGRMPKEAELRKERKSSLIGGIYKYHGNLYELGQKLNINVLSKPKGFYNEAKTLEMYKALCIQEQRYLTASDLHKMGHHGLANVISKSGGIYNLRKRSGLEFTQIRLIYQFYNLEKAIKEYKNLSIENNRFLTRKELYGLGYQTLANFIAKEGFTIIKSLTGLPFFPEQLADHYTVEKAIAQYSALCCQKGYFLVIKDLISLKLDKLAVFIRKYGIRKIRKHSQLNVPLKKRKRCFDVQSAVSII